MTTSPSRNAWPSWNITCKISEIMKTKKPKSARAEAPATRTWLWCGAALATLAVVFWAYGPAMHSGFLFDDTTQHFALPTASQPLSSWIGPVRPVLMFSYWVNSRISMEDTSWYHYFNILIHALAGIFVFLVIRRLLEWAGAEESSRTPWAAFGTLLFLLHPLQAESVAYISGRSDSLCGMLSCASFAAFLLRHPPSHSLGRRSPGPAPLRSPRAYQGTSRGPAGSICLNRFLVESPDPSAQRARQLEALQIGRAAARQGYTR